MKLKLITLIIVTILFASIASANYVVRSGIDSKKIDKVMKTVDLKGYDGTIEFVNYDEKNSKGEEYYGYFEYHTTTKNNKTQVTSYNIRILKPVHNLTDDKIKCVIDHTLAHYQYLKTYRNTNFSYDYANKYGCERWDEDSDDVKRKW